MSAQPHYILSLENRPFSDPDAAAIKAQTLTREAGGQYQVVPHPDGGYAVMALISHDEFSLGAPREDASRKNGYPSSSANELFAQPMYPSNALYEDEFEYYQQPAATGGSDKAVPPATDAPMKSQSAPNKDWFARAKPSPSVKREPPQNVTIINNHGKTKERQPPKWTLFGGRQKPNPLERTIKLRPALRGFYMQYIMFFLGCVFSTWPIEALTAMGYADVLTGDNNYAQWVPHLVAITGGIVVAMTTSRVVWGVYANYFVITANSVKRTHGIISRDKKEIPITKIDSVNIYQGLIDRILNIGRLEITIPGTSGVDMVYTGIVDPEKYQREIYSRMEYTQQNTARV